MPILCTRCYHGRRAASASGALRRLENPCAIHRIMEWAIRDTAVVVCKAETVKAFEALYGMLSHVSMQSADFENTLLTFFGPKTNQFIHELINFARSPYDDPIAYELNVKYRAVHDVPDDGNDVEMPCTSAEALKIEQERAVRHSFVEFAARMNNDDYLSFDAALNIEEEDCFTIDALGVSRAFASGACGICSDARTATAVANTRGAALVPCFAGGPIKERVGCGWQSSADALAALPSGTLPNWMTFRAHLEARRTLANFASSTGSIRRSLSRDFFIS
ncbi:uncharacterized protein LOC117194340 [Drosophila miranda]|uniref:uncharacterized protein LOC117194340 n=1 Tax=Drosophila miranda TaxID=7229 RepID=UPI00143F4B29|nr:uncharacterized protein LOC117194340 [Drosophila miranda]